MSVVKSYSFPDGDIRGDMFYIKHNSDNFTVIDCYLKEGDDRSCRKDKILEEIAEASSNRTIHRFISTHPHNDHILGIEALNAQEEIINFYAVENDIPADMEDDSLTKYLEIKAAKNTPIVEGLRRCWLNQEDDAKVRGSSGITFLWPKTNVAEFKDALEVVRKGGNPNNISCVFTYSIDDGATYMWMGDMHTDMQEVFLREMKDELGPIDILFHPHHGRKTSAPPKELLDILNPKIIVISNAPADDLNYDDPDRTITQNRAGDVVFVNEGDYVHVYTANEYDEAPKCLKKLKDKKDSAKYGHYIGSLKMA